MSSFKSRRLRENLQYQRTQVTMARPLDQGRSDLVIAFCMPLMQGELAAASPSSHHFVGQSCKDRINVIRESFEDNRHSFLNCLDELPPRVKNLSIQSVPVADNVLACR